MKKCANVNCDRLEGHVGPCQREARQIRLADSLCRACGSTGDPRKSFCGPARRLADCGAKHRDISDASEHLAYECRECGLVESGPLTPAL